MDGSIGVLLVKKIAAWSASISTCVESLLIFKENNNKIWNPELRLKVSLIDQNGCGHETAHKVEWLCCLALKASSHFVYWLHFHMSTLSSQWTFLPLPTNALCSKGTLPAFSKRTMTECCAVAAASEPCFLKCLVPLGKLCSKAFIAALLSHNFFFWSCYLSLKDILRPSIYRSIYDHLYWCLYKDVYKTTFCHPPPPPAPTSSLHSFGSRLENRGGGGGGERRRAGTPGEGHSNTACFCYYNKEGEEQINFFFSLSPSLRPR